MTSDLTLGDRIAWYRHRRGMSQEVLAGLVGRTSDWLSKLENGRIQLDRLSVIKTLADALDVSIGDLTDEPSLVEWTPESGARTVPALRDVLMDYRQITPLLNHSDNDVEPQDLSVLRREIGTVWTAYQESRYGYVTQRVPDLITRAQVAIQANEGEADEAYSLLAMAYQSAAMILTKLGEADLAWIAADRGLAMAQQCGNNVVIGSLFRSVAHSLLSTGRFDAAKQLTDAAAAFLQPHMSRPTSELLSVYGTLFLAGSIAAARSGDRDATRAFLGEAGEAAQRLGHDANYFWTAFGPTNVTIHRVATAMELGDVQIAIDLGPQVDASTLPAERQVRHAIELARAYTAWNRIDEALTLLLDAEQLAPEQVRYHFLSRHLVQTWIQRQRRRPNPELSALARRLKVVQ